jgi:hypothetical protein
MAPYLATKKSIGILLMHPLKNLTSTALVTCSSIPPLLSDCISSSRPTPASSSPNLSPSSANASPLKQYDRPFPGPSFSPCDRNIPSFSPSDRPNHRLTFASDRQTASLSRDFRQSLSPCDRSPLPKCNNPSMRRESAKRSACLHLSKVSKRLVRSGRILQRYNLGFLWGLWLMVAVQNIVRYSPQGMPSAERSFILSGPTQPAGAAS